MISGYKKTYSPPRLICYGEIRQMTQAGGSNGNENSGNLNCTGHKMERCSDRRAKEDIVRIGSYPFGIGLYLFNYKPEFRDAWGHDQQFGVMADEVEQVMPEAVSIHPDGYKMVNYAMLGISRNLH